MRSRVTVLCGVLLFSVMFAAPAHAGPWSAFVAWLSDLDPKSGGAGIEMSLFCPGAGLKLGTCELEPKADSPRGVVVKSSASFLLGTLNENGGTIFVTPVLGIVEWERKQVWLGFGAGAIHVGGTLVGGVTRPLIQVARVTVPVRDLHFGLRAEANLIPKGFPAGAFAAGAPETGTEWAFGLSVIYIK